MMILKNSLLKSHYGTIDIVFEVSATHIPKIERIFFHELIENHPKFGQIITNHAYTFESVRIIA